VFAARGYLVASIQHDLPTDAPLITREGSLYVGRLRVYEQAEANILFAMDELKKIQPNAEYNHITLVGHSNGGDISMFFAQQHPELVKEVVTLDNLRVPFVTDGRLKILSFRSKDPNYKTDPGVLPSDRLAKEAGIDIVKTGAQHTDMSEAPTASRRASSGLGREDSNRPPDPRAMGP
jgi:pimeloyl-ACP methyl ester carboxylesterase